MTSIGAQRALEALRNGVPNTDAVRSLGCMQPEALDRFTAQLDRLAGASPEAEPAVVPGTLISGNLGTGKSHTLAYFEQKALERKFVVSRVVISKETPLHDPAKVFLAAVREARLPESRGSLLHELAGRMDYRSARANSFLEWALRGQPYGMVAASVLIDERSHDAELKESLVNWWSGEKLEVKRVRDGLKDLGMPKAHDVKAVKLADLAPVRFEFAARLARAVGYSGWVILIDEVELIARYSLLQRARAYAELARWLAAVSGQGIRGITAVATITDWFDIQVLTERNDRVNAPDRLKQKGDQPSLAQAMLAKTGIDLIGDDSVRLHLPTDDTLMVSYDRLRSLYESAYGYKAREYSRMQVGSERSIRSYIRRWISEWDLNRLYGERDRAIVEETVSADFSENADVQQESEVYAGERE